VKFRPWRAVWQLPRCFAGGIFSVASLEGVAPSKAAPVTREPEEFTEDGLAPAKKPAAAKEAPVAEEEENTRCIACRSPQQESLHAAALRRRSVRLYRSGTSAESEQAPPAGFTSTDSDFDLVTPTGGVENAGNVMEVKLPEKIATLIEESARKINRGLTGKESRTR